LRTIKRLALFVDVAVFSGLSAFKNSPHRYFVVHALAADFGDEFSTQDVNPLILFVMQVKRRAAICMVLPYGKYIDCKPPVRVGGTNHLG
jgi:hypothetical protein